MKPRLWSPDPFLKIKGGIKLGQTLHCRRKIGLRAAGMVRRLDHLAKIQWLRYKAPPYQNHDLNRQSTT